MELDRFFNVSQSLLRDKFVLGYSGHVSEDILQEVGNKLRERLENHACNSAQFRNVFSIFVELMQNIIRYGVDGPKIGPKFEPDFDPIPDPKGDRRDGKNPLFEDVPPFGIIMVSESDGMMSVIAGNYIATDEGETHMLADKVAMLQSKTPQDLREMYRAQLRNTPDKKSKGASLGLIEIARKSTLPIACEMTPMPDGLTFFMIKATV